MLLVAKPPPIVPLDLITHACAYDAIEIGTFDRRLVQSQNVLGKANGLQHIVHHLEDVVLVSELPFRVSNMPAMS